MTTICQSLLYLPNAYFFNQTASSTLIDLIMSILPLTTILTSSSDSSTMFHKARRSVWVTSLWMRTILTDRRGQLEDYGCTYQCNRYEVEANWPNDKEENHDKPMASKDSVTDFPHAYSFLHYMCNRETIDVCYYFYDYIFLHAFPTFVF